MAWFCLKYNTIMRRIYWTTSHIFLKGPNINKTCALWANPSDIIWLTNKAKEVGGGGRFVRKTRHYFWIQAFAAGADIKEMQNRTMAANYTEAFLGIYSLFIVYLIQNKGFIYFPLKIIIFSNSANFFSFNFLDI